MPEVTRILSLGAGVQSSTLCLMAAHGFVEPFEHAIFADTQAEPASVYAWLRQLQEMVATAPYPFPIHTVTAGSLTNDMLLLRTSKLTGNRYIRALVPAYVAKPGGGKSLMGRKCTAEYKVRALLRKQRELAKVPRGCKEVRCITAIGISLDEAHRMKPSKEPWTQNVWPLIDMNMTREDCLTWMDKMGFPRPPRSACVYCPFHSDAEWRRLRDEEPDEFARAVEVDKTLRDLSRQTTGTARLAGDVYLHATLKPLSEVDFGDIPERDQVNHFGNECEGLCGV